MSTIFATELRLATDADDFDVIAVLAADGEEIAAAIVEPSEDRAPYDAALRSLGFAPVGDDQARLA
ncbi:MAG: hypothetical protein GX610_22800 [Rhodococcus sp.]|nr:hypothetical protein [Rhodococcus sp. (in: high G+C Gram-positive bacteria)]